MDIVIALDETEKFLEQNKAMIPDIVRRYLIDVIKQDRDYLRLVESWSERSFSEKESNHS